VFLIVAFTSGDWRSWAAAGTGWFGGAFVLLVWPLHLTPSAAIRGIGSSMDYAALPLIVVAPLALRIIRPLAVGFLPLVGLYFVCAAALSLLLERFGISFAGRYTPELTVYEGQKFDYYTREPWTLWRATLVWIDSVAFGQLGGGHNIVQQINQPLIALLAVVNENVKHCCLQEAAITKSFRLVKTSEAAQSINESVGIRWRKPRIFAKIGEPLKPCFIVRLQYVPHITLANVKHGGLFSPTVWWWQD